MSGNHYHHLMFGASARRRQLRTGSHVVYGARCIEPDDGPEPLTNREISLITRVGWFHMSSVTDAGWPYIQFRSGPRGFLHHLGANRLGFADLHGNSQFVSVGNIEDNGRVALFVADHPRKLRIKIFGRAEVIDADTDPELLESLMVIDDVRMAGPAERSIIIDVEAFDWNCARSMVPLYERDYIRELNLLHARETAELRARIIELEDRLDRTQRAGE